MKKDKMPVGIAVVSAMNPDAMQKVWALSKEQKQEVITETHAVKRRDEMHRCVDFMVSKQ